MRTRRRPFAICVTVREANLQRLCLICGAPGANLLRLADGRNVRVCDDCLRSGDNSWTSYEEREPLPCEIPVCACGAATVDSWTGAGVHHGLTVCARVFTAGLERPSGSDLGGVKAGSSLVGEPGGAS